MLNVANEPLMQSVIMLNAVMLSVVMLNIVMPKKLAVFEMGHRRVSVSVHVTNVIYKCKSFYRMSIIRKHS